MKIVIAGASGFIGRRLVQSLVSSNHQVIALSRNWDPAFRQMYPTVEFRNCDLFSVENTVEAVSGASVGIYLVHSMLPTAQLDQSSFADSDLLLADHFSKALSQVGGKRIIYLGGLVPDQDLLSKHIQSRLEVESVLAGYGNPVTTLRAGLILGAEGSSFQMMISLVQRLPVMICPAWTNSRTQCIDLRDVIQLIQFCIDQGIPSQNETFDIGCTDIVSYRELMQRTTVLLGLKRSFYSVPYFTPGLSRLWVQLITGAPSQLVGPLVQSLRHSMLVHHDQLLKRYNRPLIRLDESLKQWLPEFKTTLRRQSKARRFFARNRKDVRSIQRVESLGLMTAMEVASEYFRWLALFLGPWIQVIEKPNGCWSFFLFRTPWPLLVLRQIPEPAHDATICAFKIQEGLLVKKNQPRESRVEFYAIPSAKCVLTAIHDFRPALPWIIYQMTQAKIHLWIMQRFTRHLSLLKPSPRHFYK